MEMTAALDGKLNLTLDLGVILDKLPAEDRASIIKHVGFDSGFIKMVIEMLSTGSTEDGWWFGDDTLQEMRDKLTDSMRGLQIESIATLRSQRDALKADLKRHSDWAWAMYHARGSRGCDPWPELPKWAATEATSREMAALILDGKTPA